MNNGIVNYPTIPTEIVVHLGAPDEAARDISIPFVDYIKNVASSEIYPTWPDAAIEANVLAEISFALNRIYNEWYPSKGYMFDITSLPAYDQTYTEDREVFDVISKKVDDIFNNYIYRRGQIQPLNAVYCDGRVTTCDGLLQWQSATLARQNKTPLEILRYFYGNDIEIFEDAPTGEQVGVYPGYPIEMGNAGDKVRVIQRELNRISNNYPAIPKIPRINGTFGVYTENAVKKFQEIFNLLPTGIVDYATWYKIKYIYNAVKRVNDIYSEGILEEEAIFDYGNELKYSDTGLGVRVLHYVLGVLAFFDPDIPSLKLNGVYNDNTKQMVLAFQNKYGLPSTGVVDADTWQKMVEAYKKLIRSIPKEYAQYSDEFFQGRLLTLGMSGEDVEIIQRFLLEICRKFGNIPGVRVSGIFDDLMERSVMKIQSLSNLPVTGVIDPVTWYNIVEYSKE